MRNLLLSFILLYTATTLHSQNCSINAGLNTTICLSDTIKLFGTRSGLFSANTISKWTQISGPNATINQSDSLITTVKGYAAGLYIFKLSNRCEDGVNTQDTVSITILPVTIAHAGKDTVLCPTANYFLHANKPLATETGEWIIISNSGGITIDSVKNPNSHLTLQSNYQGISTFRWNIMSSAGCVSHDEVAITNLGGIAPVNAGLDQTLDNCYSTITSTKLSATYGGSGLGGQVGIWTFISGPSLPTMSDANSPILTISNLNVGTYTFRYTVSGPCAAGYDEVSVIVPVAAQNVSLANAGSHMYICDATRSVILKGNDPSFSNEAVEWIQTGGPVTVHIHTPNNSSTLVTGFTTAGEYFFAYKISNTNSGCMSNSEVRIRLYETGTINGGPDQILPCNVTEYTLPFTTTGYGYRNYRILSGPAQAFSYPTLYTDQTKIKDLNYPGTYRIELNYSFGSECPAVNDFVDITVSRTPTGANAGSAQNFLCTGTSTQLAGNNPMLTGLGAGRWSQVTGNNPAVLVNPNNYICDISGTLPGAYTFRWTISGGNSCPDNHDDIKVIIPGRTVTPANCGEDKTYCYNSPVILHGNEFRADETAKWTVIPGGVSFTPNNTISNPVVSNLHSNSLYTFIYTISNRCGSASSDTVKITTGNLAGPSFADAGPDQCLPGNSVVIQLRANSPANGYGIWKQVSGPDVTITNPTLSNTIITGVHKGNYKFAWIISVNGCSNITSDTVLITISDPATIANAGVDIIKCGNSVLLNANTPLTGTGHWSQISGDGNAIVGSANNPSSLISNLSTGLYVFRWTIDNYACAANYDDVLLNIASPPSNANAGPDQSFCSTNSTSVVLKAATPVSGAGQWVWVTGSTSSPTILNSTSATANVSDLGTGTHIFRWIVSGGAGCPTSSDDVAIKISSVANAGSDKSMCNSSSTSLDGNIGSNGLWSQVSGPLSTITQSTTGGPNANVTGLLPHSSYTFRYTIPSFAGCPSSYDDIIVNNGSSTLIPNAGADDVYCNATSFILKGSAPGPGETGTWSVISGTPGALFLPDANTANATMKNVNSGIYILQWTISNGSCSASDIKRIDNYIPPTLANAGKEDTMCFVNSIFLYANTPLNGVGKWTEISGPNIPAIEFPSNPSTKVSGLTDGTYKFLWTISNYSCTASSDEVQITVLRNADIANAGSDTTTCSNSVALTANMPSGTNKCLWSQYSGPNNASLSSDVNPTCSVYNLIPGIYKFVWKIYNARCYSTDTVEVKVIPGVLVKAGNDFTLCNSISSIPLTDALVSGYTNKGQWSIISGEGTLSDTMLTDTPYKVTFSPQPGYTGPVVLSLSASDECQTVSEYITITVLKTRPVINAINDSTETEPNTSVNINVLKNDNIVVKDVLNLCKNDAINIKPAHGTAMLNSDGTISYKPVTGYTGVDSFNYKICSTLKTDTVSEGCSADGSDNAWVIITIEGCILPNSFSPDGDGVNDVFEIPCAQGNTQINIFNRWGIEVYRNDFYKNDWSGTYNGSPLPEGTYFYMLQYSTDNSNKLSQDGFITLRR